MSAPKGGQDDPGGRPDDRFSERWPDFTDYIIDITAEIWDRRRVLALHDYYHEDVVVRRPSGVTVGLDAAIRDTFEGVAQTTERGAGAEDVIWSVDGTGHFHSSHRCCDRSIHTTDDAFGPATGTRLRYWLVADCAARDEKIDDEWLVSDRGAVARQLGWEPAAFARHLLETNQAGTPLTPETDVTGPYRGRGNDDPWGERYEAMLAAIMGGDPSVILAEYDGQCHLHYPGGVEGHGPDDANRFWAGLRAAFPRARFEVRHRTGRHDPLLSPRAAIRWTLTGAHEGWGLFGRPTGAQVHILGISHAEYGPWGLRREWTVYDEVAIWTQILAQTGGEVPSPTPPLDPAPRP